MKAEAGDYLVDSVITTVRAMRDEKRSELDKLGDSLLPSMRETILYREYKAYTEILSMLEDAKYQDMQSRIEVASET